jgi:WD40 repeat protein
MKWPNPRTRCLFLCILFGGLWLILSQSAHISIAEQTSLPPYVAKWSPDGAFIATGGIGYLRLWRSDTQQLAAEWLLSEEDIFPDLTWHPTDHRIAAITSDRMLRIWDVSVQNHDVELSLAEKVDFSEVPNHPVELTSIDWSPNGEYVAVSGPTGGGFRSYVWNALTGEMMETNGVGEERIAWAPDSKQLVRMPHDFNGNIGPVFTPIKTKPGYVSPFRRDIILSALAWSPDGDQVASGYVDGIITISDVAKGTEILWLATGSDSQRTGTVLQLVWTPDNDVFAVVVAKGGLQWWDVLDRQLIGFTPLNSYIQMAISPDGQQVMLTYNATEVEVVPFVSASFEPTDVGRAEKMRSN